MNKYLVILLLIMGCQSEEENFKLRRLEKKLELEEAPLLQKNILSVQLPVTVKQSELKCNFGDRDALIEAQAVLKSKAIIMTVESLQNTNPKVIFRKEMSLDTIHTNLEGTFANKLQLKPGIYGLYICTDKNKSGSCQSKQTLEINELIFRLFNPKTPQESKVKSDVNIFFKPVILTKDHFFVLKEFANKKNEIRMILKEIFKQDQKSTDETINTILKTNDLLSNMQIDIEEDRLLVNIPGAGHECNKETLRIMQQSLNGVSKD